MMKAFKVALGTLVILVLGFITFLVFTGIGVVFVLVVNIMPVWQIVVGTLIGSVAVIAHILGEEGGK